MVFTLKYSTTPINTLIRFYLDAYIKVVKIYQLNTSVTIRHRGYRVRFRIDGCLSVVSLYSTKVSRRFLQQ